MRAAELLNAFDLPIGARVDRRVPKSLLTQHGAPTSADKRKINEGIEQVQWVAALKPGTIGVSDYRDELREYLEIAVLSLVLREGAKLDRLIELLHRAVPYPMVVIAEHGGRVHLSLAHKRWSQGESGRTVLDGKVVAVDPEAMSEPMLGTFLSALALGGQPRLNLFVLYQGWMDTLLALHAAGHTNLFSIPESADRQANRRDALGECERIATEIASLRAEAAREKQVPKQIEMNLKVKRLEAERAAALSRL